MLKIPCTSAGTPPLVAIKVKKKTPWYCVNQVSHLPHMFKLGE